MEWGTTLFLTRDVMQIRLALTVLGEGADRFQSVIEPVTRYPDGQLRFVCPDIRDSAALTLINDLAAHHLSATAARFNLYRYENKRWRNPSTDWIAAAVRGGEIIKIAEENHFDPVLPLPCRGLVPLNQPIVLAEQPPRELAVAAGFHHIYHQSICDRLRAADDVHFPSVLYSGVELTDWHRVQAREIVCLDSAFLHPFTCRFCGTPGITDYGILFGRRISGRWVRLDRQGLGHFGREYECLVSPDVASDFTRRLDLTGWWLVPVLDANSDIAARVLEVISALRQLSWVVLPL
jgi:hypothetical protein